MPGDERLPDPEVVSTRAIQIAAPASAVWPWLVQLGWGRAGWYSYDLVEAAMGAARSVDASGRSSWRSLDQIVPAHQQLAVGEMIPLLGARGFDVVELVDESHLVASLGAPGHAPDSARGLRFVWTLALAPTPTGVRLLSRTRMRARPSWIGRPLLHAVLDPGHAVMEQRQLRGIRDRAERHRPTETDHRAGSPA